MSAAGTVRLKVDVDTTDALRKIREAKREIRGLRRGLRNLYAVSKWGLVIGLVLDLVGIGYGIAGLIRHSTFEIATGCLFLILANRR